VEERRGNGFLHFSCAIALRAGGRRHGDVLHIPFSATTWISAVSEWLNVMVLCIGDIDRASVGGMVTSLVLSSCALAAVLTAM